MAWIEGRPAGEREALDAAARLLRDSRLTVLTGAPAEVETVRALLRLGALAGGVVDHEGFEAVSTLLSALREAGIMLGAPAEMRRRADRWLLVGADPFAAAPELRDWLFARGGPDLGRGAGAAREVLHLGGPGGVALEAGDTGPALAQIRAALNGRRHAGRPLSAERAGEAAAFMRQAAFGCVVFAPAELDALDVELLCGLVEDLNRDTRVACLPIQADRGAFAAAQVAAWTTGFPLRTSFGRGFAEFDPLLNGAARRVESGEATLALHVGAGDAAEPSWTARLPVIAVGGDAASWANPPRIAFAPDPGAGGRVVWDGRFGGFVAADGPAEGAAGLLAALAERLGGGAP